MTKKRRITQNTNDDKKEKDNSEYIQCLHTYYDKCNPMNIERLL